MTTLYKRGAYTLVETRRQTKILTLRGFGRYAWVWVDTIGELLVATHRPHKTDHILAEGTYCLYDVEDDPSLTDMQHLELSIGNKKWQGYLLPTGLPGRGHARKRIIPTVELVGNPRKATFLPRQQSHALP